jgi:hypothetical protein
LYFSEIQIESDSARHGKGVQLGFGFSFFSLRRCEAKASCGCGFREVVMPLEFTVHRSGVLLLSCMRALCVIWTVDSQRSLCTCMMWCWHGTLYPLIRYAMDAYYRLYPHMPSLFYSTVACLPHR